LAVLADDLHRIGLPADLEALGKDAAHLLEDERVSFAEAGERTGARADMADLDRARLGVGRNDAQHRRRRNGSEPGLDHGAARRPRRAFCHADLPGSSFVAASLSRAVLRCCRTFARRACCWAGVHTRNPSPLLKPSLPLATSFSR